MYKKRCEERRNTSLGARRCKGTGRGESPNAKEEAAGTPAEESRRREVGGGDQAPAVPAAALPLRPRGVERVRRGTA